jgi:signal transduction histidine kinase
MVSVVLAQLSGGHEPAMFEVSILGLVVGLWCPSLALALPLGLLAATTPVAVYLVQDPGEVNVGIWILGIVFPWVLGRANARERRLAALLDDSRRELAHQSLLDERRRIARDVHDLVGHGLAAVMLQVTSARHVLHRDPVAAEEALRSAEEVGRRSMRELRRTVTLLRTDEGATTAPPVSAGDVAVLIDEARAGGLAVYLRMRGNLADLPAGIGIAVYRIAQEALANAARHAPRARTDMLLERAEDGVRLEATTVGPVLAASAGERDRPRYGLAGMRERATVLGGALSAGPAPDGWRVSCWLPVDAADGGLAS